MNERTSFDKAWERRESSYLPCEYRKSFEAPVAWMGKGVALELEGYSPNVKAFLNGRRLGLRAYGRMGYSADLSPYIRFDASNTILIRAEGGPPGALGRLGSSSFGRRVWLRVRDDSGPTSRVAARAAPRRRGIGPAASFHRWRTCIV